MILSIESRIPPRPGTIVPESLQSPDLLKTDSARSPVIEQRDITAPRQISFTIEPSKM